MIYMENIIFIEKVFQLKDNQKGDKFMSIVYIKGYDFCVVTEKEIEKEGFLSELTNQNPNIKDEIISILDNNGYVIGLKKNNVLKSVYLFELNGKILTFKSKILTNEINEKTKNEFKKSITIELKEKLVYDELEKIDWNDIEILPKKKTMDSFLMYFIGMILGILFDHIGYGIIIGCILALLPKRTIIKKKDIK